MKSFIVTLSGLTFLAVSLTLLACGDTSPTGDVKNKHVINLTHVQDAASGLVYSYLEITRDSEPFNLAAVAVFNTVDDSAVARVIRIGDGEYGTAFADYNIDTTRQLRLNLTSAIDEFNFSYLLTMPDTFSFEVLGLPGDTIRSTDGTLQVSWTASRLADGYLAVLEPANPQNQAVGFSDFVEGATSLSIPISAFHDGQGFREGAYYLWVAAYKEKPIDLPSLPFTLPEGFTDNIERVGVSGRAGALYLPSQKVITAAVQ